MSSIRQFFRSLFNKPAQSSGSVEHTQKSDATGNPDGKPESMPIEKESVDSIIVPEQNTAKDSTMTPSTGETVEDIIPNAPTIAPEVPDLSRLNEYQVIAVQNNSRACLVNANVGSGKTTVLTTKILYLHQKGIAFTDMVVLTFTNKAANEIKDRIRSTFPEIEESDMQYFGTFHSVALKMLKTIMPLSGTDFTQDFSVISPEEQEESARNLIAQYRLDIKYQNKLSNRLEQAFAGEFLYGTMKKEDQISELISLLRDEQIRQNKMSFDDLIDFSSALMPAVAYRPKWIFIDEFQDSDDRLYRFIQSMTADETHLFAVGDPNQIIYSWRGSDRNIFERFKKDYRAIELSLPINYRSCGTILEAAKTFLGKDAELYGVRDTGTKIVVKAHYNAFQEAQYLVDRIHDIIAEGAHYGDIAILYRLQRSSQDVENVFRSQGIPYRISVKKTINDIPVLNWLVKLLKYAVNDRDTDSIIFVLMDGRYGLGMTRREAQKALKEDAGLELLQKAKELRVIANQWQSALELYAYLGLQEYLKPNSYSYEEDRKSVEALLNAIDDYRRSNSNDMFIAIRDYIASAALYGINFMQNDCNDQTDAVNLLTLHAAKGLEYRYVFIIGANNGVIPLVRSRNTVDEDEEKRLFFVGITRAKDSLEISYCTMPDTAYALSAPSPYLYMLPANLTEWDNANEETDQTNVDPLQALRKLVKQQSEENKATVIEMLAKETERKSEDSTKIAIHAHYGEGIVVAEDEMTITVLFEGFGEKQFMKMFNEVTIVE